MSDFNPVEPMPDYQLPEFGEPELGGDGGEDFEEGPSPDSEEIFPIVIDIEDSPYNVIVRDFHIVILVDALDGDIVVNLPQVYAGRFSHITVKKIDETTNKVTISGGPYGYAYGYGYGYGAVIEGLSNIELTVAGDFISFVSDGEEWFIINDSMQGHVNDLDIHFPFSDVEALADTKMDKNAIIDLGVFH